MTGVVCVRLVIGVFFVKQKTAYEVRISDWSSDVCSSDLIPAQGLLSPIARIFAGHIAKSTSIGGWSATAHAAMSRSCKALPFRFSPEHWPERSQGRAYRDPAAQGAKDRKSTRLNSSH